MPQVNFGVKEERKEEIDEVVENGPWKNRTEYLRAMVRVGESGFAALDPRTSDKNEGKHQGEDSPLNISDEELLTELRKQSEKTNTEYVPVDDVVQPFLEALDQELTNRLLEMGTKDSTGVTTDGKGGYKIDSEQ